MKQLLTYKKTGFYLVLSVLMLVTMIVSQNRFVNAEVLEGQKMMPKDTLEAQHQERLELYKSVALLFEIEWHKLGAVDQYERNTKYYRPHCNDDDEVVSVCFHSDTWYGLGNSQQTAEVITISNLLGIGQDGDGDGLAELENPIDRIYTLATLLTANGTSDEMVDKTISQYYDNEVAAKIIGQISQLFSHYNKVDLSTRVFPIKKGYRGDYTNNYGTGRSWGGARIHEGVDIFAHYGTPVVATSYGVVEIMGWNKYGGYRIGIRDIYNTYQYYAHLGGYAKDLKVGDIVEPGQVIGTVSSTGYGKEGTMGKFPPHLHFGFYKYTGENEWSFNPYSYLRKWPKA